MSPFKPARQCRNRQCPGTTTDPSGYCEKCKPKFARQRYQEWDKNRPSARQRGYTTTWDKARVLQLRMHPLCSCGKMAVLVHHIKPIDEGGELLDQDNLESMCRDCHERLHGRKA